MQIGLDSAVPQHLQIESPELVEKRKAGEGHEEEVVGAESEGEAGGEEAEAAEDEEGFGYGGGRVNEGNAEGVGGGEEGGVGEEEREEEGLGERGVAE